jgi:TolB-like protein/DNA-binding winged helix-turn-helix (wHTH) protein/Flp pilus assembly protein TadD
MSLQEKHFYHFGPFRLDPWKRRLSRGDELISLTPKAFDTLLALVQQSGKTIEKDDLMKAVWPGVVVEENNLNQNITALRKSLGDSRQESHYIATIPGLGYRFVADVTRVDVPTESETESSPRPAQTESIPTPVVTSETVTPPAIQPVLKRRITLFHLVLAIFALLVVAAAVFALWKKEKEVPAPLITSIAVLPLENLSGDPEQEYFADGMTDTLIGDLAKIEELRVISRTSSMHYKGSKKSLPQIANELKVDAVVEGTVQRIGERIRVSAQLIHGSTDRHLWAEIYERDVQNVFDLQSEIARAIAAQVKIKMSQADQVRLAPRRPVNPKAFDDYLQGRYLFWNKRTEENINKAIGYFQSAIQADPSYALAYAALADCYNSMGTVQVGALPPIEARARAEEAAVKALEIDPTLAEAHTALGFAKHFNWSWDVAEQEFKRAIELNPNYAYAHNAYAGYLMSKRRVAEAIASSSRARELDPLSLSISVQRGFILENARQYDEAIEQLGSVVALDQNHYQAYWMLGHTYACSGRFAEGVQAAERAVELSKRAPGALGILGFTYGLAGRKSDATKVLDELLELNNRRYVTPAAIAWVYIGLGEKERAFVWLEKAYLERSNFIAYLSVVPLADSLRSDPRFSDLLRRVGLPE